MNKKYGKLMFGGLIYAKDIIENEDGSIIMNPTEQDYIEHGYKEVVDNGIPEELIGKNIEQYYEIDDIYIVVKYRESVDEEPEKVMMADEQL